MLDKDNSVICNVSMNQIYNALNLLKRLNFTDSVLFFLTDL